MIIRKAKPSDARRLCELGNQFLREISMYSPIYKLEKLSVNKKNIASWRNSVKKPEKNFYTFVAEENGKVLAYLELIIKENWPKEYFKVKKYGWVECIVVDNKIRGKGIGQKLFDFAIKFFKKNKLKFVRISFLVKNEYGANFWKKNKFKEESSEMIRKI